MTIISCPTCGTQHAYDIKSPFRPFCSERCRLIDLGAWSQERYRIPLDGEEKGSAHNDLTDVQ